MPDTTSIGKWLMIAGAAVALVGLAVWLLARWGVPLGALPGDVRMRGEGWSLSFPIVTCLVVSIVLTIVLNLIARFWR